MKNTVRLLALVILAACMAGCGCGKTTNPDGSTAGDNTVSQEESSTLESSMEAIVEHMMPEGEMTKGVSVFVRGDNTMIGVLAEPFDKDYYAIDARLREMVKEDLEQFNESYQQETSSDSSDDKREDALICEGLGLWNGNAILSLGFADWTAYAEYMETEEYAGTDVTVGDLKKNDVLEGSFSDPEGTDTDPEKILKETRKKKYHIIYAQGEISIFLERPVAYVSGDVEIVDEYSVKTSGESCVVITQ